MDQQSVLGQLCSSATLFCTYRKSTVLQGQSRLDVSKTLEQQLLAQLTLVLQHSHAQSIPKRE